MQREQIFQFRKLLQKNYDELEKIIETCTLHHTHYKATQLLQEAGVRIGVICKPPNSLPMNICSQDFFPGNRIALKWAPENIAACQSNFQVNLFLYAGTSYLTNTKIYHRKTSCFIQGGDRPIYRKKYYRKNTELEIP